MLKRPDIHRLRGLLPARSLGPRAVDESIDYHDRCPSPAAMIRPDGAYDSGWYETFSGRINPEASPAPPETFQRWLHISFDDAERYVVANIADMFKAGNVALLVADKKSGRVHHASLTRPLTRNRLEVDPEHLDFRDPGSGSFIRLEGERLLFSVHAQGMHLTGEAHTQDDPLVQITGYHPGYGTLQWWGNLVLDHATLTVDGEVYRLSEGCYGAYDRTLGHRRRRQNWNWISATGVGRDADSGEALAVALQLSRDRARARPITAADKYAVWIDGDLQKLPELDITYDASQAASTSWRIRGGTPGEGLAADLTFQPRFHRRELERLLWLYDVDFNQYYGELSGTLHTLDGRRVLLDGLFALTEDSRLAL